MVPDPDPDPEAILRSSLEGREDTWHRIGRLLERGAAGADLIPVLLQSIDDSHYSAVDWAEALLEFDTWLDSREITARPLPAMIGYVECCTMTTAETLAPPNLAGLVVRNLEEYGFDATRPA